MTTSHNKGMNIAIVILAVLVFLLAFRSIFWVLPFGVFRGVAKGFHGTGSWLTDFRGLELPAAVPLMILPILFIALWAFVLIWVYRDAERRGMNGVLWLLLVLIGNIVGLLVYAIVRSERPEKTDEETKPALSRDAPASCPGCGKPTDAGHRFCPFCGKDLGRICSQCGRPVEASWKVCPHCGAGLNPGDK